MIDLRASHSAARNFLARRDDDPLAWWQHSSQQSREATRLLSEYDEVYVRAANVGGKTEWEYAAGVRMLQKFPDLDGVPLPQWRGKLDAVSLELDYTIQKLSSQQTILRLLGNWPHKTTYHSDQTLGSIRVMPLHGNDDIGKWSTLTFMSQKNLKAGTGVRGDLILANEPPRQDIWEEIRKAAHAGRAGKRIIGATPIKRREWWWLAEQYGKDCQRDGIRAVPGNSWVEVRWSLMANSALSEARIASLLADYAKNPALYEARVYGDYCDASGKCPFDEMTLVKMLQDPEWAREPIRVMDWDVPRETRDAEGAAVTDTSVPVEIFGLPKLGSRYYQPQDLASGIDDSLHDHAGLIVTEFGSGDLYAQYEGALAPYRMGILGVALCRQYHDAMIQPEANKWALGCLQAISDSAYGNVGHEIRQFTTGEEVKEPGFTTDEKTRGAMISAIQAWIDAYRAGVPYARPSRKIIECLLDTILDEKGKPVAGPGSRDELMILWGQSLRKTVSNRGRSIPRVQKPPSSPDQPLIDAIRGMSNGKKPPFGQRARVYRGRP